MLDKKFIVNLQGKDFVIFEGLLAEFHANGGKSIETEETDSSTLEYPRFKATAKGEKGTFTGHGDANADNVNSMIAKHKYRMAETRAIARALRWYNNIGMCSSDELGGSDTQTNAPQQNNAPVARPVTNSAPHPASQPTGYTPTPEQHENCPKCNGKLAPSKSGGAGYCIPCWKASKGL